MFPVGMGTGDFVNALISGILTVLICYPAAFTRQECSKVFLCAGKTFEFLNEKNTQRPFGITKTLKSIFLTMMYNY